MTQIDDMRAALERVQSVEGYIKQQVANITVPGPRYVAIEFAPVLNQLADAIAHIQAAMVEGGEI